MAAESIDIVHHVCKVFEATSRNWILATILSLCLKGFKLTLSVLQEQEIFISKTSRHHHSYKKLKPLFDQLNYDEMLKWIKPMTNAILG